MGHTWAVPAEVVEVVDGDTVRLDLDLGWHIRYTTRVRIAAINAPEISTPAGVASKIYAETLLRPGDSVMFISTKLDKYGRPLGHLHYGQGPTAVDFGALMVAQGHAVAVSW
jgi:endonuclease YncB( thermonuclease family)